MIKSIKKEFTEKKINAKIKNMALGKALSIINSPANLEQKKKLVKLKEKMIKHQK